MNCACIIAKALKHCGVKQVFLFPGGTIAPLLDALLKEGITYYCAINEQGAGYAAIGAAKVTGCTQVVMVTSGPGVTNLLSPVADAYFDSVPLLIITGQVARADMNIKKRVRQTGFQEIDASAVYKPVVKESILLEANSGLFAQVCTAFNLTVSARHGPVHIDLPMDVQRSEAALKVNNVHQGIELGKPSLKQLSSVIDFLNQSRRPLILAGNGIYLSAAVKEFRQFLGKYCLPTVTSLPAVGTISSKDPLNFGLIGHAGEYHANLALYHADLVLVLGARMDLRQIGTQIGDFCQGKIIIRVDIDHNELKFGRIKADQAICTDMKYFLQQMNKLRTQIKLKDTQVWIGQLNRWKGTLSSRRFYKKNVLSMYDLINAVDGLTVGKNVVVTSGVGIHQQMVARYFSFDHPKRIWLTSSGHGTMGFDIPANIGALMKLDSSYTGIVFVGDGSFQMNSQELALISQYKLPVKIFVLDNKRLGLVSQFQLLNWKKDPSCGNKANPDFCQIGRAYGLQSYKIQHKQDCTKVLTKLFADKLPALVHCYTDKHEDILPMLLAKQKLNQMYPFKGEIKL